MGKGDMRLSLCKGDMIWCLENSSDSMNILLQLVNYIITTLQNWPLNIVSHAIHQQRKTWKGNKKAILFAVAKIVQ